jgi:hypothetical protein
MKGGAYRQVKVKENSEETRVQRDIIALASSGKLKIALHTEWNRTGSAGTHFIGSCTGSCSRKRHSLHSAPGIDAIRVGRSEAASYSSSPHD